MLRSAEMQAGGGLSLFSEKHTVAFHFEESYILLKVGCGLREMKVA